MRPHLRLMAALSLFASGAARAAPPTLNQPAPAVAASAWLNVPGGGETSLDDLRGHLVVLEFWGTY
ncbi:MAG: hypothetical protein U1A27_07965 [Phycisphaerae bacterium]